MYTRSADFYDAIYHFKDYSQDARRLVQMIREWRPRSETLLDVACGTGQHLHFLRHHFRVEGLDLNAELLDGARRRCPDVPLHNLDMRDFNLGRRFDVVTCLFSAIGSLHDTDELLRAIDRMAAHLGPEGLLIIEPWFSPDTYWTDRLTVNLLDTPAYKGAWMYVSRREGNLSVLDIQYLVAGPNGIEHFSERHELMLFSPEEIGDAFSAAGLTLRHQAHGLSGRGLYIGTPGSLRLPSSDHADQHSTEP